MLKLKKNNYGFKILKTSSYLIRKVYNILIKMEEIAFPEQC